MPGLDDLLLPEGSRIVHIGPHKTGTTAIQGAFADARPKLGEYGMHYPGEQWQIYRPALALTGSSGQRGTGDIDPEAWPDLVREIEGYGEDRTLISSESLVHASPDRIAKLRDDLDPERVQIVRMIRRYDKVLPSMWQQQVVNGYDRTWRRYVGRALNAPEARFWKRFGFAPLTQQWADVVGPDRVTVVVVNEDDRGWLLRVMERLTGLPEGLLVVGTDARYQNRSLSWAEAEMIRRANVEFAERGWSDAALRHYLRFGVKIALKPFETERSEGRPQVSPGRYDQLEEITRRDWEDLHALGVRVVGELDWLLPPAHDGSVSAQGSAAHLDDRPLLLAAPKVVASASAIVAQSELHWAPSLGEIPDLSLPVSVLETDPAMAAGPAREERGRWWRRRPRRTTVVPPLEQVLVAWERHLADGGTDDLADVLAAVTVEIPTASSGRIVITHAGARSYDELAAVRAFALEHPKQAAVALRWLQTAAPEPSYAVPDDVLGWARERATEIRAAIERHGLEVEGDLAALEPPASAAGQEPQVPAVSAGLLLAGTIAASQR